jgi:hypothetical protein
MTVARAAHCPPLALFHDVMARCRPSGNASPEPFEASTRRESEIERDGERACSPVRALSRARAQESDACPHGLTFPRVPLRLPLRSPCSRAFTCAFSLRRPSRCASTRSARRLLQSRPTRAARCWRASLPASWAASWPWRRASRRVHALERMRACERPSDGNAHSPAAA